MDDFDEDESSGDEDPDTSGETPLLQDEEAIISSIKPMRRGVQYIKSGWIRGVTDTVEGRVHFIRAKVRASMNLEAHVVSIALSNVSGVVHLAECGSRCAAGALGRCAHVGALLLFTLFHMRLNGHQGKKLFIF